MPRVGFGEGPLAFEVSDQLADVIQDRRGNGIVIRLMHLVEAGQKQLIGSSRL